MADHMYKPSEVPKGQRWQHFKDYYRIPAILAACGIIAVISILKTTVFSPEADIKILAASSVYVDYKVWDEAAAAMSGMPFDYDEDGNSLAEFTSVQLDEYSRTNDPEVYTANQTKLTVSLAAAESALQIVDDALYTELEAEQLIGTYSELPDTLGHAPDEVIKIPLKELTPFKNLENLPDGLYMTLRPRDAMQLGKSEKKLTYYENQIDALMTMLQ